MTLFWIPLVLAVISALIGVFADSGKIWKPAYVLTIVFLISSIAVAICIDRPTVVERNNILPGTCITCKMEVQGTFYAIGCDGHEYHPNASAWALLNVSVCQ